jgi:hypothetical protein
LPGATLSTVRHENAPPSLYARVLGTSWLQLPEPLRLAHAPQSTSRARGRLRITHGRSDVARWLARLLRLPRESDAAETRLVIASRVDGEHWCRTFDDRRLDTVQYEAGECLLAERIGVLEFRFRLEASEGSLLFHQLDAALVCGSIRLPIPAAWAPRVEAREDSAGAHRIGVHVRVVLPALGPLLTYDGIIDVEDSRE